MRQFRGECARLLEQLLCLQQVDDVDAIPLTEDEAAHLGVPSARLVTEMHAGLQQLLDSNSSHVICSLLIDVLQPAPPVLANLAI